MAHPADDTGRPYRLPGPETGRSRDPARGYALLVALAASTPLTCLTLGVPPGSATATALAALTAASAGLLAWDARRPAAVPLVVADPPRAAPPARENRESRPGPGLKRWRGRL